MTVHDIIEGRGGPAYFFRLAPPDPTELERFAGQWPAVAARIGITIEPEAPRVFSPGVTYYQKTADNVSFGQDFWRDLVDRHSRESKVEGDLVISQFELAQADQERWPRPQLSQNYLGERPTRSARVVTQLGRRGNATVATIESTWK
jgi:hypothetical protein